MNWKVIILNVALALYLISLFCSIGISAGVGATIALAASAIVAALYVTELFRAGKDRKILSSKVLLYTLGVIALAEIFIQDFSISIDQSLFGLPGIYQLHMLSGFVLLTLFAVSNYSFIDQINGGARVPLLVAFFIFCLLSLIGFLSLAGIFHASVKLIYYAFVFLTFFYFIFFLLSLVLPRKLNQSENFSGLLIASLLIVFWIVRWQVPDLIPPGFYKVLFSLGFLSIVILPLSILLIKKVHFLTVFILYTAVLDLYFVSFDKEFSYLVDVGMNGCVGYNDATEYAIVNDPGVSKEELFAAPTATEIGDIIHEWEAKDFGPRQVKIVYAERNPHGDSIKVISHSVNGQKHYGVIRIPAGIDTRTAPILLSLQGGGAGIDVLEPGSLSRISSGICRDVLDKYVTVAPSFRGDIVRGKDFCFRSEGYTGDVWLGAAEDAVSFLEVVKLMYSRSDSTRVIAMGVSRGATVGLVIGALTKKVNYIISISTHTNFVNLHAARHERVGSDYARIFFTPKAAPEIIRRRMIASSPLYFADRLPRFEIHSGMDDILTTADHSRQLEQRLKDLGRSDSTFRIYFYEGRGHAYDDDNILCARA